MRKLIVNYYKWYSYNLNRDMEFKVYGDRGIPFIYFPTQYMRFFEVEDKGVINHLANLIETGKIMIIACDNVDKEGLSNFSYWDKRKRLEIEEAFYNYFILELLPCVDNMYHFKTKPVLYGMSFGAYQAMNFFLRRPDLFNGVMTFSGIYNIRFFFNDYFDDLAYLNSPIDSISGLNNDEYIRLYNEKKILMVVSNGAYENEAYPDTVELARLFSLKGIKHKVFYWTSNYPHDWSSWHIYLDYYLNMFL